MLCDPVASPETEIFTCPELRVPDPAVMAFSVRVTEPVGMPAELATCTVTVIGSP